MIKVTRIVLISLLYMGSAQSQSNDIVAKDQEAIKSKELIMRAVEIQTLSPNSESELGGLLVDVQVIAGMNECEADKNIVAIQHEYKGDILLLTATRRANQNSSSVDCELEYSPIYTSIRGEFHFSLDEVSQVIFKNLLRPKHHHSIILDSSY